MPQSGTRCLIKQCRRPVYVPDDSICHQHSARGAGAFSDIHRRLASRSGSRQSDIFWLFRSKWRQLEHRPFVERFRIWIRQSIGPLMTRSNKYAPFFWADLGPTPANRRNAQLTLLLRTETTGQAPRTAFWTSVAGHTALQFDFSFWSLQILRKPARTAVRSIKSS